MKYAFLFLFLSVFSSFSIGQDLTATQLLDSGYMYYQNQQYEAAIMAFESAIKLEDSDAELYYLLGVCQSEMGLNNDAILNYDKALAIDPEYPEVYFEKGYAFFLLNKFKEAIEMFDKAIELRPNYAQAWFNRGSVKCIVGYPEEATADWKKAMEYGATIPDLECDY